MWCGVGALFLTWEGKGIRCDHHSINPWRHDYLLDHVGSVAERGKEIFIYSSLGLAPLHVGALFLIEAGIYALIGGMGGYLTAQALGWGLQLALADFGLIYAP